MAAPICSDVPIIAAIVPIPPMLAGQPLGCGPIATFQNCPGSSSHKHPESTPHTVCVVCDAYNRSILLDLLGHPGQNVRVTVGRRSPPLPAPNIPWQLTAGGNNSEMNTGILDPIRGPFPIFEGFKTRMCQDCEALVEAQHYFVRTLALDPGPDSLKWKKIPTLGPTQNDFMYSCTCTFTMDMSMPVPASRPRRQCHEHRKMIWVDLIKQRDVTDDWLRNAMRHKSGKIVKATPQVLRNRVRDGTYRACPCGNDVRPWVNGTTGAVASAAAAIPQPRVVSCMGCGGHQCMRWAMPPAVPGGALMSFARFKRLWSRRQRRMPRMDAPHVAY